MDDQVFAQIRDTLKGLSDPSHFECNPGARIAACRNLVRTLEVGVKAYRESPTHAAASDSFLRLLDQVAASDIREHANEYLDFRILQAEASMLAGRTTEAQAILHPISERFYNTPFEPGRVRKLLTLDTLSKLAAGQFSDVRNVAYGRLVFLARIYPSERSALFDEFAPAMAIDAPRSFPSLTYSSFLQLLSSMLMSTRTQGTHALKQNRHRWASKRKSHYKSLVIIGLAKVLLHLASKKQRLPRLQVYEDCPQEKREATSHASARPAVRKPKLLITRAMGGLGDILTMTPALRALSASSNAEISFATKREFFSLLETNDDFSLLDIESLIDLSKFDRWIDLSRCPATAYERQAIPNVTKGRVETFASGMEVPYSVVKRFGTQPKLILSHAQRELRERVKTEWELGGKGIPVFGIQALSRDGYKSVPNLLEMLSSLDMDMLAIVFHDRDFSLPPDSRFLGYFNRPLDEVIAAVAACDYVITVDSLLLHLAGALDKPTLAIFGPTGGEVFSRHIPRRVLLNNQHFISCSPCWRNGEALCHASSSHNSLCLQSLTSAHLSAGITALLAAYPLNQSENSC